MRHKFLEIPPQSDDKHFNTLKMQFAIDHTLPPCPPSLFCLAAAGLPDCLPAQPTVEQDETDTSLFTYAMWVVLLTKSVCVCLSE